MPYAIVKIDTEQVVRNFSSLPTSFDLALDGHKKRIVSPVQVGDEGLGYRFVEVVEVNFPQPGTYFTQGRDISVLDGSTLTITREWIAWTQLEIDAYETQRKDAIAAQIDAVDDIVRAVVLVYLREFNLHSTKLEELLAAAANATSLTQFKNNMAAIQSIPQRTAAQLKTAIRAELDGV